MFKPTHLGTFGTTPKVVSNMTKRKHLGQYNFTEILGHSNALPQ
jgi:hypothetical protein